MKEPQELLIEAVSLAEAKKRMKSKIPNGFYVSQEQVIFDGNPVTLMGVGETVDGAFATAHGEIPPDAEIVEKEVITQPGNTILEVRAFGEESALTSIRQELKHGKIVSIEVKEKPRRGFLRIGRKVGFYAVTVKQLAVTSIIYKKPAKITIEVKRLPETVPAMMRSLDELAQQTLDLWPLLDRIDQPALSLVLESLDALFYYLDKYVSKSFNGILREAKRLFPENENINGLAELQLGQHQVPFDLRIISRLSIQFKEGIKRIMQLREFIGATYNATLSQSEECFEAIRRGDFCAVSPLIRQDHSLSPLGVLGMNLLYSAAMRFEKSVGCTLDNFIESYISSRSSDTYNSNCGCVSCFRQFEDIYETRFSVFRTDSGRAFGKSKREEWAPVCYSCKNCLLKKGWQVSDVYHFALGTGNGGHFANRQKGPGRHVEK